MCSQVLSTNFLLNSEKDEEFVENELIIERLNVGTTLSEKLARFSHIQGVGKLSRRIQAEVTFLKKLQESSTPIKKEHILSSNLGSLRTIVELLEQSVDPVAVLKSFSAHTHPLQRIDVDLVSNGGAVWYKAVARKASALEAISKGKVSCGGQKSVIEQAKAYFQCAQEHPHHFKAPRVVFYFSNCVSTFLASKLVKLGVEVEGELVEIEQSSDEDSESSSSSDEEASLQQHPPVPIPSEVPVQNAVIFLDITCMVAYVSSMTNGGANFVFPKPIYNLQAEWERRSPAKPKLDALFGDNQLVTCRDALVDFQALVEKIGGPKEKERAKELINRIQTVEDTPSERVLNLPLTSNVKERSRIIFGTADQLRIVIVTANSGFIRSAASQGTEIAHHLHEPRVLTEQQEAFAVPC